MLFQNFNKQYMKQAMVFAAGLGTRLRPLTNDRPKALVEVGDKTLLQIVLEKLRRAGFQRVVVNVHHFSDLVIDHLSAHNHFDLDLQVSDERELLLDTGGGLAKAADFFTPGPILIHNVDILSTINLSAIWTQLENQNAMACLAVRSRQSSRYLVFDEAGQLYGWRNTKTGEEKWSRSPVQGTKDFAFSGVHVVHSDLFKYFPADQTVFSIIDTYLLAAREERILAFQHDQDQWLDVGKPETLAKAANLLAQIEN